MKVRISGVVDLPSRRRASEEMELRLLIWMLVDLQGDLRELEDHMVLCQQDHWEERALLLERISTIHQRQMELAPEN